MTLALVLLLAQSPGPLLTPAEARRSHVASALRHAEREVQPIPLQPQSPSRGVIFDHVRMLALAARDLQRQGTPVSKETLMAVSVPNLLLVAYPIDCGGSPVPPERIELRETGTSRALSLVAPVSQEALARLLPGVTIPQGAAGLSVNRMSPGGGGVVITYAQSSCDARATIDIEVTPPRKIRDVPPAWPAGLIRSPSSGPARVYVRATIETNGMPTDIEMLSGPSEFNLAAAAAVGQWQYEPMKINGVASSVPMAVTVSFSMR